MTAGFRRWAARDGAGSQPIGLALMVVSAASFALMAAVVKAVLPDTPVQAVVLSRGIMVSALFVALARRRGVVLRGRRTGLLVLRGLLGYVGLSCYFVAVHHLPLGDAVVLQYSHPLFVAMLAPFLLGERTDAAHWALVVAALLGVGLVVGASWEVRAMTLVGVAGAVFSALAYICVRALSATEHALAILVWFPLATVPPALVATLVAGRAAVPSSGREVVGHLLVGATALIGQVALTEGLARVRAAPATAIAMTGPVFGVLYGLLWFGTLPGPPALAGATLTVGALVVLALHRRRPRVPA